MPRRDRDPSKPRRGLVRSGVRTLAGGIGLVSESIKAQRRSKAEDQAAGTASHAELADDEERKGDLHDEDDETAGSEAVSHAKEKAVLAGSQSEPNAPEADEDEDEDADEHDEDLDDEWNLDDAQDEVIGESPETAAVTAPEELQDTFLRAHPPPPTESSNATGAPGSLALPVVLPQRRPKDRSRGFIRAYAPVLENCGIDQTAWLDFLDTFQKSSAANPWLNAINLAGFATMALPHGISIAVGYAIQKATDLAIELQARQRTNDFLRKVNDEFFRPRGLYCLVMTYNPDSRARVEQVDLNATIASRSAPRSGLASVADKFKGSDGTSYGEWDFPEVAPLVFPGLDQLANQTDPDGASKKSSMAKKMAFVAEYWDRRATAEYAGQNPDSVLARVPQAEFHSRYADPNNPAASGSLISFVSGGRLVPSPGSRGLVGGLVSVVSQAVKGVPQGSGDDWHGPAVAADEDGYQHYQNRYSPQYRGRRERRQRRRERRNQHHRQTHRGSNRKIGLISTPLGATKKILRKNVLYLMVVNLPSDEDMAAARELME